MLFGQVLQVKLIDKKHKLVITAGELLKVNPILLSFVGFDFHGLFILFSHLLILLGLLLLLSNDLCFVIDIERNYISRIDIDQVGLRLVGGQTETS